VLDVVARALDVDHVQGVVQLLAVHAAGVGVARGDPEQLVVAPLAGATAPGVEAGGRDVQDAGQEIAPPAVVRTAVVLRARRHHGAAAAVGAAAGDRLSGPLAHDRDPLVEPLGDGAAFVLRDLPLGDETADEVGPHHPHRTAVEPGREPQERDPHRLEVERVVGWRSPAAERELAQLEAVVGRAQRQVDPAAHPHAPAFGRLVGAGVVPPGGPVAEELHVPTGRLVQHRLLLGEHRGGEAPAHADEVARRRRRELGVEVADGGEERVAQARPVDGVVRALAALEGPREAPGAHAVGPAQQVRRDPRERFRLHAARLGTGSPAPGEPGTLRRRFRSGRGRRTTPTLARSPTRERPCGSPSAPTTRASA
jgi:hypothetical protein